MTVSAAHAGAFYAEVLASGEVWTIRDARGFPAPSSDGHQAMPFWSSRKRAQIVIDTVPDYHAFVPVALALEEWRARWLPGLREDGLLVGLNWSGPRATGYYIGVDDVERNIDAPRHM